MPPKYKKSVAIILSGLLILILTLSSFGSLDWGYFWLFVVIVWVYMKFKNKDD